MPARLAPDGQKVDNNADLSCSPQPTFALRRRCLLALRGISAIFVARLDAVRRVFGGSANVPMHI